MSEHPGHHMEENPPLSVIGVGEHGAHIESPEQDSGFHFEEIAEIESAAVSLVRKLKEKIDGEEYDTLISDDVGGRIPTLLLRKIMTTLHPDQKIETFFIASGKSYLPKPTDDENYPILLEHLRRITQRTKKALLVTQYIHSGDTMLNLASALDDSGVHDFDLAAVDAMPSVFAKSLSEKNLGGKSIYVGSDDWHQLHEQHAVLSGVRKQTTEYSPFPKRIETIVAAEGRVMSQAEWAEIFGIEAGDSSSVINEKMADPRMKHVYEQKEQSPLTPEEVVEIQKNITLARADVSLLAKKIIGQVWNK